MDGFSLRYPFPQGLNETSARSGLSKQIRACKVDPGCQPPLLAAGLSSPRGRTGLAWTGLFSKAVSTFFEGLILTIPPSSVDNNSTKADFFPPPKKQERSRKKRGWHSTQRKDCERLLSSAQRRQQWETMDGHKKRTLG